ncbi:MAG: hypothetical protein PHI48_11640 [Bacteroidales bacterium]|nr:hypothetical protein [Bacteroidales bacterium]MDD4823194.1 hypothetical protein [Bacteroidales bacterium]
MHILKISALSCMLLLDSFFEATTALNSAENESSGTYWFEVGNSSGERSIAGIPDNTVEEPATPIGDGILIMGLLGMCYSEYKRKKS